MSYYEENTETQINSQATILLTQTCITRITKTDQNYTKGCTKPAHILYPSVLQYEKKLHLSAL